LNKENILEASYHISVFVACRSGKHVPHFESLDQPRLDLIFADLRPMDREELDAHGYTPQNIGNLLRAHTALCGVVDSIPVAAFGVDLGRTTANAWFFGRTQLDKYPVTTRKIALGFLHSVAEDFPGATIQIIAAVNRPERVKCLRWLGFKETRHVWTRKGLPFRWFVWGN